MDIATSPSAIQSGRTLAALLAEQQSLGVPQALEVLRQLAAQVARLHESGRLHLAIHAEGVLLDEVAGSILPSPPSAPRVPGDDREGKELLPELANLDPPELPGEIDAARQRLEAAGIALDPRQIDLCQLGALLCRMLTGESAQAYRHSPRVKGKVPAGLRPIVERALGGDGQERFADAREFLAAVDAVASQYTRVEPGAAGDHPAHTQQSNEDAAASARASGDTTPSFVASASEPADTSVGPGQPVSAPAAARPSGDPLPFTRLGHYEIVARIGRGGMGDVYRGYERALDREVAVKVLPSDLARSDDFVRRFRTEATAVARLNHPHIVPIHFIGEDQGHHYYAMQYVEGESLADLLHRRAKLSVDETLAIVEQALAGLAAAHEKGMVHRDIKPGNILLDSRNRRALLADFGLVKSLESSATGHTATGVVMGTVDYISPEQGRGQTVDGRSDLYSMGVLLYQMVSGRLPFEADNPTALIFQHVYEPPPPLAKTAPHVPADLASIIERLLAKSPTDRHQSAEEVLVDLRAVRLGEPLAWHALPPRDRQTKTTIIRLAVGDDEGPLLPPGLTELAPPNWWEMARGRALSLFRRHAPEALQQLQNTQQQVDGAVAVYARRERELLKLVDEAESVLGELRALGQEQQAAEQEQQLDAIRLRLAQAAAERQQLAIQRDILNARLRVAGAGRQINAGLIAGGKRRRRLYYATMLGGTAVVIGAIAWNLGGQPHRGDSSQADRVSEDRKGDGQPIGAHAKTPEDSFVAAVGETESRGHEIERRLALSRDGRLLATSLHSPVAQSSVFRGEAKADDLKLWDLQTGEELLTFDDPHYAWRLAISPDSKHLLSIGRARETRTRDLRIWDVATGKLEHCIDMEVPPSVPAIGFSTDATRAFTIAASSGTQKIKMVTLKTGEVETIGPTRPDDKATSLAISPVEDLAAIGIAPASYGGRWAVDVQDFDTMQNRISIQSRKAIQALEFSGDGQYLAGSAWGTIIVWKTVNWETIAEIPAGHTLHDRLALSHDGRLIVALRDGKVELWNVPQNKIIPLKVTSECLDIAFGADDLLIIASVNSHATFFDPESGKERMAPARRSP